MQSCYLLAQDALWFSPQQATDVVESSAVTDDSQLWFSPSGNIAESPDHAPAPIGMLDSIWLNPDLPSVENQQESITTAKVASGTEQLSASRPAAVQNKPLSNAAAATVPASKKSLWSAVDKIFKTRTRNTPPEQSNPTLVDLEYRQWPGFTQLEESSAEAEPTSDALWNGGWVSTTPRLIEQITPQKTTVAAAPAIASSVASAAGPTSSPAEIFVDAPRITVDSPSQVLPAASRSTLAPQVVVASSERQPALISESASSRLASNQPSSPLPPAAAGLESPSSVASPSQHFDGQPHQTLVPQNLAAGNLVAEETPAITVADAISYQISSQPSSQESQMLNTASMIGPLENAAGLFQRLDNTSELQSIAMGIETGPRADNMNYQWMPAVYTWTSPVFYHRPLYFEQPNLERYGHGRARIVQPLLSSAHFFGSIPLVPYKTLTHHPREKVYTLGHGRPGNCNPIQRKVVLGQSRVGEVFMFWQDGSGYN